MKIELKELKAMMKEHSPEMYARLYGPTPEQIFDPFLNILKILADATVDSDKAIVELVRETIQRINKIHDNQLLAMQLMHTAAQRIVSLEAKVEMLMEHAQDGRRLNGRGIQAHQVSGYIIDTRGFYEHDSRSTRVFIPNLAGSTRSSIARTGEIIMTLVKYLMSTGVCKTGELLELKRTDPDGYALIMKWTREQEPRWRADRRIPDRQVII